jgi:anhydro-N-acetylmuramic acid kinase
MALHIGLISGTSTDAVDAAIVDIGADRVELVACHSEPIPEPMAAALRTVIDSQLLDRSTFWQLDVQVGELFACAAHELIKRAGVSASDVRAIGSHGQTVFHGPDLDFPCTVQIGDPNVIAERTGITTVADLRRRDMAAGGQGAPLAPAFHDAVFRHKDFDRVVVNVGGIANVTLLPADPSLPAIGFDTGPANTLMDVWAGRIRGVAMDIDGAWARSGKCHQPLLELLLREPYLALVPPKSTGRELFNLTWLDECLARVEGDLPAEDVQRTLCEFTAATIADAVRAHAPDAREAARGETGSRGRELDGEHGVRSRLGRGRRLRMARGAHPGRTTGKPARRDRGDAPRNSRRYLRGKLKWGKRQDSSTMPKRAS